MGKVLLGGNLINCQCETLTINLDYLMRNLDYQGFSGNRLDCDAGFLYDICEV